MQCAVLRILRGAVGSSSCSKGEWAKIGSSSRSKGEWAKFNLTTSTIRGRSFKYSSRKDISWYYRSYHEGWEINQSCLKRHKMPKLTGIIEIWREVWILRALQLILTAPRKLKTMWYIYVYLWLLKWRSFSVDLGKSAQFREKVSKYGQGGGIGVPN